MDDITTFLTSAGFTPTAVRIALERAHGDVSAAIELLEKMPNAREPTTEPVTSAHLQNALNTATGPNQGDDELTKAIALSMQDMGSSTNTAPKLTPEEEQLQRILEESRKQMTGDSGPPGVSQEDLAMAQVIEQSLLDAGGDTTTLAGISNNPNFRMREEGTPVGLKNVGNTCYFNSLLQTYFHIPELRRAVLGYPPIPKDKQIPTTDFMKELQRLFAYLILSKEKWVDPSNLLKKLIDKTGAPVNIGNQEDVSEFNELFLQRIAEGFDYVQAPSPQLSRSLSSSGSSSASMIKNIFSGTAVEYLTAQEEDGSPFESSQDLVLGHLILPITDDPSDLYTALDNCMQDDVEYKTEKGHTTLATKSVWVKRLPHILMIQQNRVKFDLELKTYKKVTSPLRFDKEIFMDRYFVDQKNKTMEKRKIVNSWKYDLNEIEKKIHKMVFFNGKSHGIVDAFESVGEFLTEKGENEIVKTLKKYWEEEKEKLEKLNNEKNEMNLKIEKAYDDYPKKQSYSLYAVWVHAGVAGSGHYWAYIRVLGSSKPKTKNDENEKNKSPEGGEVEMKDVNEEKNDEKIFEWRKFDDMRIAGTDEHVVMTQSIGGDGSSTAYFLIYMETEMFRDFQAQLIDTDESADVVYLSDEQIKTDIEESNKKFLESVETFNKSRNENKVTTFVQSYENRLAEAKQYAEDYLCTDKDMRIASFYPFLYSLEHTELTQYVLLRDLYVQTFEKGMERDIGSSYYEQIKQLLGEELIREVTNFILEPQAEQPLIIYHNLFRKVAQYFSIGLNFLLEENVQSAMSAFSQALKLDSTLDLISLKRENYILSVVKFTLDILWERVQTLFNSNQHDTALRCVQDICYSCVSVFPKDDKTFNFYKDQIVSAFNQKSWPLNDDGYKYLSVNCIHLFLNEFKPQPVPVAEISRGDVDKWRDLARRLEEQMTKLRERYPKLNTVLELKGKPKMEGVA